MFASGIFNTLSTDQQLGFLIPSSSIYFQRVPMGVQIPFISFFTIGGPEPNYTFEPGYWEEIQVQLSIFTHVPDTTTLVAYRVDQLLNWQSIPFDDVVNMGLFRTSPLNNLLLDPEPSEAGQDVWVTPLFYTARLIRSL